MRDASCVRRGETPMLERCAQGLTVERALDGRLTESEERAHVAHLAACAACAKERASLVRLREELGALQTAPNPFVMRRLRREVLADVSRGAASRERRRIRPRLYVYFAGLVVAAAALVVFIWSTTRSSTSDLTVTTAAGARYSRERDGTRDVVRLSEGEFDFDVHSHADGRGLVFLVPDGEIEDIGTSFHVVVREGHTEVISVTEGEVEFRKQGAAPMRLVAGMTYRRLSDEAAKLAEGSARTAAVVPSPLDVAPAVTSTPNAIESKPHGEALKPIAAHREGVPPTPSSAPTSSAALETGLAAEDIAYMEVIRMLRSGKTSEAREGARRWLSQYPTGLRRAEMESVVAGTARQP